MSTYDQSRADRSRPSVASGSSTGAPGLPTGTADQRAQYHPEQSGYNPATGSGYTKPAASATYDSSGQDARIQHAPSTVQRGKPEDQGAESRAARTGEDVGQKARGVVAGVHVSVGRVLFRVESVQRSDGSRAPGSRFVEGSMRRWTGLLDRRRVRLAMMRLRVVGRARLRRASLLRRMRLLMGSNPQRGYRRYELSQRISVCVEGFVQVVIVKSI